MSFFEWEPPPPPFPPQPPAGPWAPPAWDRPSEGTFPAIYPVGEIVHRSESAVVELELLRVYPNGFEICFAILQNPHAPPMGAGPRMLMRGGMGPHQRFPRVGVRFADGRTAGDRSRFGAAYEVEKDDEGMPTQPVIGASGGGGGSRGYQFSAWVFPLPPEGPLEIFTAFQPVDEPDSPVVETRTTLDATAVRGTAERAQVIWS